MGFLLSEVFPLRKRGEPRGFPALHAVSHRDLTRRQADPLSTTPRLQGIAQSESPYRQARCYPTNAGRSSLSFAPLRGFHLSGLDPVLPRNLLSWAFTSRWTASRPSRRWLCRVSKNQKVGWPLSRAADLHEVSVVHRRIPKEKVASDLVSCAP